MNEPGQGPDPLAAARNIDQQELASVVSRATRQDDRRNDPLPAFNSHTQGLAGVLMAEEDRLKRIAADLDLRTEDVADNYKAAIKAAEDAYRAALKSADDAEIAATRQLQAEAIDLGRAREAIRASVSALTN